MKKSLLVAGVVTLGILVVSCNGVQREPARNYMPDMGASRAYETYSMTAEKIQEFKKQGIYYDATPVPGTIARGEMEIYRLTNDSAGYAQSASVNNPLPPLDATNLKEAERLFLVNCAICHGAKLDGNGPLWKGGDGPYPAAPRNLLDDYSKNLADGTMFHVMTYGKGLMGSYASQVSSKQRWMIVDYIRSVQGGGKTTSDTTGAATAAKTDSTSAPAAK